MPHTAIPKPLKPWWTSPHAPRCGVSALIIAFNEERNIARAVAACRLVSDDIWVIDSHSTDRTVERARAEGANVVVRDWPGYSRQKNWGLQNLPLRHPYVVCPDADEFLTGPWADELQALLDGPDPPDIILSRRRMWWMGHPVDHGMYGKSYVPRAGKLGVFEWDEREINEHVVPRGREHHMVAMFDHHDARDVEFWLQKHIKYAKLEARLRRAGARDTQSAGQLFGAGQASRVRFLRTRVYDRLPPVVRPLTYTGYRMLLGQGWKDGLTGSYFHLLHAFWYQLLVDVFETEQKLRDEGKIE